MAGSRPCTTRTRGDVAPRARGSARPAARLLLIASALALLPAARVGAAARWELEARLGGAWNVPVPIVIRQEGHDDLRLTARWTTAALRQPVYSAWRISRWCGGSGWGLDLVHHKIYLQNPPGEVREFSISHGYNLLTLQRLEERGGWRYGAALGAVVAHPESEIRGRRFGENRGLLHAGYYVSGPTLGVLAGRSQPLAGRLAATLEARLTLSFASVPVAGGSARVPNLAAHASAGLGWRATR